MMGWFAYGQRGGQDKHPIEATVRRLMSERTDRGEHHEVAVGEQINEPPLSASIAGRIRSLAVLMLPESLSSPKLADMLATD